MLSYVISIDASCSFALFIFFFNDTAPTEIYTTDTPFPYTTLFRSHISPWAAALGLMTGSAALLGSGAPLILYGRSEEHTSELQSLMRISYAVFCLKKKKKYRYQLSTVEDQKHQYLTLR